MTNDEKAAAIRERVTNEYVEYGSASLAILNVLDDAEWLLDERDRLAKSRARWMQLAQEALAERDEALRRVAEEQQGDDCPECGSPNGTHDMWCGGYWCSGRVKAERSDGTERLA
jgi:hypothetical protein